MRSKFRLAPPLAFATLAAATASSAPAALAAAQDREDRLVIGALAYRSPFEGEGVTVIPIPIIIAQRGAFYIDGVEAGVRYAPSSVPDQALSFDVFIAARALPGEYREQITADVGLRASLETRGGTFALDYRRDISGEFEGAEAQVRYAYTLPIGPVTVTPSVRVAWQDRATANHMYGVTAEQRRKMIADRANVVLSEFEVREGGVSPGVDVTVLWPVTDRLVAVAQIGGTWLSESVRENPGLRDAFEAQALIGVGYRF